MIHGKSTVAVHTLGCKVNQCDSEALLARLVGMGFASVRFNEVADIYIINTCTVTHVSDRKSRQMIRRARKLNPDAFVAVCGCMVKTAPETEADFIFDARDPDDFFAKISNKAASEATESGFTKTRTRSFIKIQDGCDRFCSYCIVPHVRGAPKSRPMAEILEEAEALIAAGTLEIVLTGIQAASYGDDVSKATLSDLIKNVSALQKLRRLRLSSIDPWAVNDDFLNAIENSSALCSHFHLSLQSGCDATLEAMNRRYTTAEYAKAAQALRKLRPEAALTTDIIVGFPDESDSDFRQSLDFAQEMKFAQIHVFEYSKRTGTPAAELSGQIPSAIKSARGKAMRELALSLQKDFLKSQIGKTLPVLFETNSRGHSENYCLVEAANAFANTIQNVKITTSTNEILIGITK